MAWRKVQGDSGEPEGSRPGDSCANDCESATATTAAAAGIADRFAEFAVPAAA